MTLETLKTGWRAGMRKMNKYESLAFGAACLCIAIVLSVSAISKQDKTMNCKFKITVNGVSYITSEYQKNNGYITFVDENHREIEINQKYARVEVLK